MASVGKLIFRFSRLFHMLLTGSSLANYLSVMLRYLISIVLCDPPRKDAVNISGMREWKCVEVAKPLLPPPCPSSLRTEGENR